MTTGIQIVTSSNSKFFKGLSYFTCTLQRVKNRTIFFYLLVHFPNVLLRHQNWVNESWGARSVFQILLHGYRGQRHLAILYCLPRPQARSWIWSGAAWDWTQALGTRPDTQDIWKPLISKAFKNSSSGIEVAYLPWIYLFAKSLSTS